MKCEIYIKDCLVKSYNIDFEKQKKLENELSYENYLKRKEDDKHGKKES